MSINKQSITGLILAGGQARRMGGDDKGLVELNGKPMIAYSVAALSSQVAHIIINANRNTDTYLQYSADVISDELAGYCGPLAGFATALKFIDTEFMATVPCDSPFLPDNLIERLSQPFKENDTEISVAHNGERIQPVFSLMKKSLYDSLDEYLTSGERKIDRWFEQHNMKLVDFSDSPETFYNINTPEDLQQATNKL